MLKQIHRTRPICARFWEKVDKSAGPDACWIWLACTRNGGYGAFGVGGQEGRVIGAHRVAWCLTRGIDPLALPPYVVIRHSCDNPSCCNPRHLRSGTMADNSHDMAVRGRSTIGERNPQAKLTRVDVQEIRRRLTNGETPTEIAKDTSVHRRTISDIARGKTWSR